MKIFHNFKILCHSSQIAYTQKQGTTHILSEAHCFIAAKPRFENFTLYASYRPSLPPHVKKFIPLYMNNTINFST